MKKMSPRILPHFRLTGEVEDALAGILLQIALAYSRNTSPQLTVALLLLRQLLGNSPNTWLKQAVAMPCLHAVVEFGGQVSAILILLKYRNIGRNWEFLAQGALAVGYMIDRNSKCHCVLILYTPGNLITGAMMMQHSQEWKALILPGVAETIAFTACNNILFPLQSISSVKFKWSFLV